MSFDPGTFYTDFKTHLDLTRKLTVSGKTSNAVDTLRVFKATDCACALQPKVFPESGASYWSGEGESEFLCDYTYHDLNERILLALESEWGSCASPKQTLKKVMFDFKKVMNMAAPVKVMVFAFTDAANRQAILDAMAALTLSWPQESIGTIVAIACPWNDEMRSASVSGLLWKNRTWISI